MRLGPFLVLLAIVCPIVLGASCRQGGPGRYWVHFPGPCPDGVPLEVGWVEIDASGDQIFRAGGQEFAVSVTPFDHPVVFPGDCVLVPWLSARTSLANRCRGAADPAWLGPAQPGTGDSATLCESFL